jgi:hypothetical protein
MTLMSAMAIGASLFSTTSFLEVSLWNLLCLQQAILTGATSTDPSTFTTGSAAAMAEDARARTLKQLILENRMMAESMRILWMK